MTNKPMLSVELDLLLQISHIENYRDAGRHCPACDCDYGHKRGLTDEDVVHADDCCLEELRALLDKEVDGDSHAPKQQGEPVVWVECSPAWLKAGGDCATAPRICVGREGISHLHPAHSNTEQPAPVNCGALDPTQRLALCRGEKPAPVAVMRDALEQSQTDLQEGRTVSVEQLRDNLAAKFIGKKP